MTHLFIYLLHNCNFWTKYASTPIQIIVISLNNHHHYHHSRNSLPLIYSLLHLLNLLFNTPDNSYYLSEFNWVKQTCICWPHMAERPGGSTWRPTGLCTYMWQKRLPPTTTLKLTWKKDGKHIHSNGKLYEIVQIRHIMQLQGKATITKNKNHKLTYTANKTTLFRSSRFFWCLCLNQLIWLAHRPKTKYISLASPGISPDQRKTCGFRLSRLDR